MKLKIEGPIKIGENELDIEMIAEDISMKDLLDFIREILKE